MAAPWPWGLSLFDTALFTWSLCCIPRDSMPTALAEAGRVLRPGGNCWTFTPARNPCGLKPGSHCTRAPRANARCR